MPLINLLATSDRGVVREGDVVLHVADWDNWRWVSREYAHVGLAVQDCPNHSLGGSVPVIHMTKIIEHDIWADGSNKSSCVNLYGSPATLSDVNRAVIVNAASRICTSTTSFIEEAFNLYLMGDPSMTSHPLYPRRENVYSFTCANFVNECYRESGQPIVVTDNMPFVTDEQRVTLRRLFGRRLQSTPFKRVFPSYLAHALNQ
jgi:hypothetical protein